MWKYIYISLVAIALLAAVAGYFANQENVGEAGVNTLLSRWRGIARKDVADKVMGVRAAQKYFIDERNNIMKEQYAEFLKRQQEVRDQLLEIKNKRNLTTQNFLELVITDVRDSEKKLLEIQGPETVGKLDKLKLFNQRLGTTGFISGSPYVPPDRYDQYLEDLRSQVDRISDILPEEKVNQYQNQLDQLNSLEQQRVNIANELEKNKKIIQERSVAYNEKMELLQEQSDDKTVYNKQMLELSQENLKMVQEQNEERMVQQQQQVARDQRLRDERSQQNNLQDQRVRDQKERLNELIQKNRN